MYLDSNDHRKTVAALLESLCKRKKGYCNKKTSVKHRFAI